MSEKLCLQWNDFQDNIRSAFGDLREDKEFADVTLACEDGQQIEAHRVILASASPLFQKLLSRNKHSHPLIYMRGVMMHDLVAIVDFLYHGEANIFQENLDSFLAIAEELQLRGLMGKTDENTENTNIDKFPKDIFTQTMTKETAVSKEHTARNNKLRGEESKALATFDSFSGDQEELEERVKLLMEESQNNYQNGHQKAKLCKVCGKEGKGNAIKHHIEASHLEGISIPCNICNKTFRSRQTLREHQRKIHQAQSLV